MTFIDDKGNTKLSVSNGKIVAHYNNQQFDLFSYVVEVPGASDLWVGRVTSKKKVLGYPVITSDGPYHFHAEVINGKGILLWEAKDFSNKSYYFLAY